MKTLPHPTRWKTNLVWIGRGLVGIGLGVLSEHSQYSTLCLVIAAPLIFISVALTLFANYTRCPACGVVLSRPRRTTSFVCRPCATEWTCRDKSN